MSRAWTMAEIRRVEDMWAAGIGPAAIAQEVGRTANAISMQASRFRARFERRATGPRRIDRAGVFALVADGFSVAETAVRMGCSERTVRRVLERSGQSKLKGVS